MKTVSFSGFKDLGIKLEIDDEFYNIFAIPYPIEKELYQSIEEYQKMGNMTNIPDEKLERMKFMLLETIKYKRNKNENFDESIITELGVVETIGLMLELMKFCVRRVQKMQENANETDQKKTIDQEIQKN